MGVDFAIEFEPDPGDPSQLGEEEIADYYLKHCGPGAPPLAEVREHVVRALAAERVAAQPDPLDALHSEFVDKFGRDKIWWDKVLTEAAAQRGVTALGAFQVGAPQWCEPTAGLRTVRTLQEFLLVTHAERDDQLACLALVERLLTHAEQRQRRWRLLALW